MIYQDKYYSMYNSYFKLTRKKSDKRTRELYRYSETHNEWVFFSCSWSYRWNDWKSVMKNLKRIGTPLNLGEALKLENKIKLLKELES